MIQGPKPTDNHQVSTLAQGTVCPASTSTINIGSTLNPNNVTQPGSHNWDVQHDVKPGLVHMLITVIKSCKDCGHTITYQYDKSI